MVEARDDIRYVIEHCKGCDQHKWNTRHVEANYE